MSLINYYTQIPTGPTGFYMVNIDWLFLLVYSVCLFLFYAVAVLQKSHQRQNYSTLDPCYNAVIRHHSPLRVIARITLYWNKGFRHIHAWKPQPDIIHGLSTNDCSSAKCHVHTVVVRWEYQMSVLHTTLSVPRSERVHQLTYPLHRTRACWCIIRSIDYLHGLSGLAWVHLHQII